MKILHTSDLHLGKSLMEESFIDDQRYILNEILDIIVENDVDVLLIPGDIYDKSVPSSEATVLFDEFLASLSKMNVEVLITSGNHDSNDRLGFGSRIFEKNKIHIVTTFDGTITKFSKEDVDFYMLPFIKPVNLKHLVDEKTYEKINTSNDMMKWVLENNQVDKNRKNILLCHEFVMWNGTAPETSDSESISLNNLGTIDAIDANLFDDYDYVALGHIHRPQKIKRESIRYSGTPLAYSFSEVRDNKGVVLIDTEDLENITTISLIPKRKLSILRGTFLEVMSMESSNDLIKVELLDENVLLSPMEEIKKKFPNALQLVFVNKNGSEEDTSFGEITDDMSSLDLFKNFFEEQNGRIMSDDEEKYLIETIDSLKEEEE